MPNSAPEAGALDEGERDPIPTQTDQTQEWEVMARAWLRAFPEAKEVTATEVEAWIDLNHVSLPSELKSMERSELIERLLSIQNILRLPAQIHGEVLLFYFEVFRPMLCSLLELYLAMGTVLSFPFVCNRIDRCLLAG